MPSGYTELTLYPKTEPSKGSSSGGTAASTARKVTVKEIGFFWNIFLAIWAFIFRTGKIQGFTTFWNTILLRKEHWNNRQLLAHELTHVDQIAKLGIFEFTWEYLRETFKHGYHLNSFEVQARNQAKFHTDEVINSFVITFKRAL